MMQASIERVFRLRLEAVIKQIWTSTYSLSMDGVLGAETVFIS